jgi:iron complex outermembrane receptor protein
VGPASLSGIFAPNSAGAKALGISGLRPEKSTNLSVGFVFNPAPKLTITLDAYSIYLRDRIVQSSSFTGYTSNCKFLPNGYTPGMDGRGAGHLQGEQPGLRVPEQHLHVAGGAERAV